MADRFDVIDLSDSFILADHRGLTDVVIELDTDESGLIELNADDSIVEITASPDSRIAGSQPEHLGKPTRTKKTTPLQSIYQNFETELKSLKKDDNVNSSKKHNKLGECPICFDSLGQNPLASTKCGHVYCMKCLEKYLQFDKRCPTCRQNLKGKAAYHPLYLSR